jgi:hypothetical protein
MDGIYVFCHRVICKYRQVWGNFPVSSTNWFYLLKITFCAKTFFVFVIFIWNRTDSILELHFFTEQLSDFLIVSLSEESTRVPGQDSNRELTMRRSPDWNQDISQKYKMGFVSKGVANKLLPAKRFFLKKPNWLVAIVSVRNGLNFNVRSGRSQWRNRARIPSFFFLASKLKLPIAGWRWRCRYFT